MKQFYSILIFITATLLCGCGNEDLATDVGNEIFDPSNVKKEIDSNLLSGFISGEISAAYTAKERHEYELSDKTGNKWVCMDDSLVLVGLNPFFIPQELNISDGLIWIKNDFYNSYDRYGHLTLFDIWVQYCTQIGIDCTKLNCYLIFPVTENDWNDISYGYKVEIEKISKDEIRLAYVMTSKSYGLENPVITRRVWTYGRVSDEYSPDDVPSYLTVKERDRYMIDKIAEYYGEDAVIYCETLMRFISIAELRKLYL